MWSTGTALLTLIPCAFAWSSVNPIQATCGSVYATDEIVADAEYGRRKFSIYLEARLENRQIFLGLSQLSGGIFQLHL